MRTVRTDTQRVESYTRWTIYGSLTVFPLMGLAAVGSAPDESSRVWGPAALLFMAAAITSTGLACLILARLMEREFADPDVAEPLPPARPSPALIVAMFAAALTAAVAAVCLPVGELLGGRVGAVAVALSIPVATLAPILRTAQRIIVAAAGVGVITAVVALLGNTGSTAVRVAIVVTAAVAAIALSVRVSVWIMTVVQELERSRTAHAALAVAEERLRFSRDLHDVVGRALTAIAVKSELAGELARRGHASSADQMNEVRDLSHDTMREVRAVVAGYRSADLSAELHGARSVLTAAGASTTVRGAELGGRLPHDIAEALGWVIREAVTNVVRHAQATTCTIELTEHDQTVHLRVSNDGPNHTTESGGTGLIGLRERLRSLGGTLNTTSHSGMFTLVAVIPTGASTPGVSIPRDRSQNVDEQETQP